MNCRTASFIYTLALFVGAGVGLVVGVLLTTFVLETDSPFLVYVASVMVCLLTLVLGCEWTLQRLGFRFCGECSLLHLPEVRK